MADQAEVLLEEYKIIQGKIDKLGEDKFKVRSWCFTIVAGTLAGAKLSGALTDSFNSLLLLLMFVPMIVAFQFVELKQRKLANWLGLRALEIEDEFKKSGTNAPCIARFIVTRSNKDRKHASIFRWLKTRRLALAGQTTAGLRNPGLKECLIVNADMVFYVAQYFIVGIFMGCWAVGHFLPPKPANQTGALVVKIDTNEFALGVRQTNVFVTNFVEVLRPTTNFVEVVKPTTNFVPVYRYITNTVTVDSKLTNK